MAMIKIREWDNINGGYQDKCISINIPNKMLKTLSKNKRKKLKKYGVKLKTANAKSYGIIQEYYNFFDSHKECRNPRTILIEQGL